MAWKKEKKNHRKENVLLAYTEALQPQPEIVIISEKPGKEEDARQITAQNIHLTPKKERKSKMTYKNREGYPDPTSGKAIKAAGHMPTHIYNAYTVLNNTAGLLGLEITGIRDKKTKKEWKRGG